MCHTRKEIKFVCEIQTQLTVKNFLNAFISEDLTPLRSNFCNVKKECNNEFVLYHTNNGDIRIKKSAKKEDLIDVNEKDLRTGPWLVVSTPDNSFKHNADIKFSNLNYQLLLF